MKYTLAIILILGVTSVAGAYAWAHFTNTQKNTEKLINNIQSLLFYGVLIVLLGTTFYYYLN